MLDGSLKVIDIDKIAWFEGFVQGDGKGAEGVAKDRLCRQGDGDGADAQATDKSRYIVPRIIHKEEDPCDPQRHQCDCGEVVGGVAHHRVIAFAAPRAHNQGADDLTEQLDDLDGHHRGGDQIDATLKRWRHRQALGRTIESQQRQGRWFDLAKKGLGEDPKTSWVGCGQSPGAPHQVATQPAEGRPEQEKAHDGQDVGID